MFDALQDDPLEFGKNLGKAMLDWDTWADDPARALGHLLPDAIAAVATGGAGTAATRGAKGGRRRCSRGCAGWAPARRPGRARPPGRPRWPLKLDLDDVPDVVSTGTGPRGPDTPSAGTRVLPRRLRPLRRPRRAGASTTGTGTPGRGPAGTTRPRPDGLSGRVRRPRPARTRSRLVTSSTATGPGGTFASPEGTPFDERALPPSSAGTELPPATRCSSRCRRA